MQLSVIIVSYNVQYYLEQCLHSVLAACKNIQAEIIVIDNASGDKSIDYLQPAFPGIHFIKNETNTGFAKANNRALREARGKYILYLNPDTIISENAISDCISFLDEHNETGAAGVKMIDGAGNFLPESKRAFPSVMASFFKLSGMAALFPGSSLFNKYALGNLEENTIHKVDVLSGAFLLSRREILLSLNGFDEDFFMYGEDIDLSYRIQQAGYKNYYLGNITIIHFKGESTQKDKAYVKNFYGAMKIFVYKHYKNLPAFFLRSAVTAGAIFSLPGSRLKGLFSRDKNEDTGKNFILAGDEDAARSASAILSTNNYPFHTMRVSNGEWSMVKTALNGNSETTPVMKAPNPLVFCLDGLTYAECIRFVGENKNKFVFYWHYRGSGSIISGSRDSVIPQIYIAR